MSTKSKKKNQNTNQGAKFFKGFQNAWKMSEYKGVYIKEILPNVLRNVKKYWLNPSQQLDSWANRDRELDSIKNCISFSC